MFRLLLIALLALPLCGQVLNFKDVKLYERKNPNDKPKKVDGRLGLDRDSGALAFVKDNNVLVALPLSKVTALKYWTKGDRVLAVTYDNAAGSGHIQEFELDGDNRENLVSTLEAVTGKQAERIDSKR